MFNFDKQFFEKNQKVLLFIANKKYLRWILGIGKVFKEIKISDFRIDKITPSSLHGKIGTVIKGKGKYKYREEWKAYIYSVPLFAENLAYNLSPFSYLQIPRKPVWRFSPIGLLGLFIFGIFASFYNFL